MIQSRHLPFRGYLMFRLKHFRHLAVFALLAVAACGRQSTVTMTVDPTTTTVSEQPTATLVQSHPTLEAPPSPIVLPTSTEIVASGPTDYPAGVNPLTGLEVASPEKLERRPLLIKVSNFPRGNRPQWGLSLADLVFEHYTEAGSTRFSALFFGSDSERVGPIRSARFFDVELMRMYNAISAAPIPGYGRASMALSWPIWRSPSSRPDALRCVATILPTTIIWWLRQQTCRRIARA